MGLLAGHGVWAGACLLKVVIAPLLSATWLVDGGPGRRAWACCLLGGGPRAPPTR